MYQLTLYLNTAANRWSRKPPAREILFSQAFPALWLARLKARSLYRQLIPGRAAWVVTLNGDTVAEFAEQIESDPESFPCDIDVRGAPRQSPRGLGRILNWPKRLD